MKEISGIPKIFNDNLYLHCLSLARLPKNDRRHDEVYGSVLVKEKQIIGQGFNRAVSHPYFKLERPIRQGWVNHAEIEALNNALMNHQRVEGSDLYVAGYFCDSGLLFFQQRYTCVRSQYLFKNMA